MVWRRYVAIGDSTAEGLDDPDGAGGYRGWADRLAEHLDEAFGDVLYANLAVRGRRSHEVRDKQLPRALALEPDLVALAVGVNDVLRPSSELHTVVATIEAMLGEIVAAGATVVTFTQPDPVPVMPIARVFAGRMRAYNAGLRTAAARTGAVLVDLEAHPVASDPRLWSEDRLHASSLGHQRVAAALADALGVPGSDAGWANPLPYRPPLGRRETVAAELAWARLHLAPWIGRRATGRSSGDGVTAKRPELLPVTG